MFAEHPLLSVTTNQCLPTPVSPLPLISAVSVCPPPPHSRLLCILWAVVGGTHGGKKKTKYASTGLQQTLFFFFLHCTTGAENGTLVWEEKKVAWPFCFSSS